MNKDNLLFRILKKIVIIILVLVLTAYVVVFLGHKVFFKVPVKTTITAEPVGEGEFTFGVSTKKQSETVEEHIYDYAKQIKRYSEIASEVWPNGAPKDQYTLIEDVDKKEFWMVSPEGEVEKLTEKEALEYDFKRADYKDGFSLFKGKDKEGMYISIREIELTNYNHYEGLYHLGSAKTGVLYTHELFHLLTQMSWNEPDEIVNLMREDRFEDEGAREKRYILMNQLMDAIAEPEKQEEHILRAVSTYEDYKEKYKEDYRSSVYFDKIEGLAFYFELMTGPYMGYPEKVNNLDDVHNALTTIMSGKFMNIYGEGGTVSEGYTVGGFAGILLDRISKDKGIDSSIWKDEMANNPNISPMEYLANQYSDAELPEPESVNKDEYEAFLKSDDEYKTTIPSSIFELLYDVMYK